MSVLIRGLRMPDGCGDCPFCSKPMYNKYGYAYYQCDSPAAEANGRDTTGKVLAMYCNGEKESFPNFCPLVEVPPHGRLIDADSLDDAFTNLRWTTGDYKTGKLAHWGDRKDWCLKGQEVDALIKSAPPIIPAEDGE